MTVKILLVAVVGTLAISSSLVAAEAPQARANLANVRWQDDPTEMWGVAAVQMRIASTATKAGAQPVATDDHDRGRTPPGPNPNPGTPPGRGRTPPGPRSPHK